MAKKSFEENLTRLEEIAELMEKDETSLESSLKLYKEGTELAVKLSENLKSAKQQVGVLKKTAEGAFSVEPFDESED